MLDHQKKTRRTRCWTPAILLLGRRGFDSEAETEAAMGVLCHLPVVTAVKLLSEMYASYGERRLRCSVRYRWRSLHYQYLVRVQSLVILTALWVGLQEVCVLFGHLQLKRILSCEKYCTLYRSALSEWNPVLVLVSAQLGFCKVN
jgi:hypothetical protein